MYQAAATRYEQKDWRHAGESGLVLPPVSLGLWRHFGHADPYAERREVILAAFDAGIFHFDVADHYGTPDFGASEELLGRVLGTDLRRYRDEIVVATKVGYEVHDGPYGTGTSRKAILRHIDDSLRRLQTDYVDVYYAHRFDDQTPLEETVRALDDVVRQGKALYIGISNFDPVQTQAALSLFHELGTPVTLSQMSYNMFNRSVETDGTLDTLKDAGMGLVAYGPLSEGLLTDRYLDGIPEDFPIHPTNADTLAPGRDVVVKQLNALNDLAQGRDQTLAQMALAWLLRDPVVASVIIGTTSVAHLQDNLVAARNTAFSADERARIDAILAGNI